MRYSLDDASAPSTRRPSSTRCSARAGSGTTAGRRSRPTRRSAGWSHFNDDTWELYHTDVDRSELHDLAAEQPGEAPRAGQPVVRRGRRATARSRSTTARRSRSSSRRGRSSPPPRDRYVYFPDTAEVPESQAVNIRNRSYTIGALVDIPAPGARGRAVRARVAVRRARPLRQGQPAALRQQLRRA